MEEPLILKLGHVTMTRPTLGVIGNWSRDLGHAILGVKFSYSDKGLREIY